ncbi:DUF305 domain-containing protein [Aureimonas glaciei]|uniref:DUF305 domain-containing protein n=1 Tax=Aureimonas glaciei TaxID=1776957 RepID=A0A916XVB8_9HYPH|nr:DUF305 domain-containing protein [Aureimonas glaciei]GGD14869.1 hypothetical protein GCM10011335_17040 [Aureimonas glaciei]
MTRQHLLATLFSALLLGPAVAQDKAATGDMAGMHHGAPASEVVLPAACLAASEDTAMAPMAHGADLDPVQAANHAAMQVMDGPMMRAATIKDADLAFNCGMVAHHAGAIAMAKVELEMGKDEASKALASRIIAAQEEEIAEMTAWVEAWGK